MTASSTVEELARRIHARRPAQYPTVMAVYTIKRAALDRLRGDPGARDPRLPEK